ncbi:type IV secretion system protein [Croceibacterium sp. LX-88]|uniref:Type IV secretion system protein n=1 Tax=Croceibacterium selenioxidans TaxID=2838833 RepID=A0ABS5W606_9SPHN|nr:type IV secretion system protein [Croceibacterium selenioxidans]MBT2134655.1 type IV secretion system protein [Croceibacterium selenioxidans]
MPCPTVTTGDRFLVETLSHLDCQAQTLGSFGFQSLAQTGSPASVMLSALLTLFIALYGIRLLFGSDEGPRDLVNAVLKVGIVLTLAVSWPAWRTLAYDTVLFGPAEVASSIMPSTLPSPRAGFAERLQALDSGIASLTYTGTGRQTGQLLESQATSGFRSIALTDETALGWSRPLYLASTIGPIALLRIASGLLLALAPLIAGLLLFDFSRGLFVGWVRGLALVALGSLGFTVLLSVELAVMEPWLADVLSRRNLGYATPTAPTELLALVLAFTIASAGLLFLLGKVAFQNTGSVRLPAFARDMSLTQVGTPALTAGGYTEIAAHSRALAVSEAIATQIRREEISAGGGDRMRQIGMASGPALLPASGQAGTSTIEPLGSSHRRNLRRDTSAQRRRDNH